MTSNNKLFQQYLRHKSNLEGISLKDSDFIVRCRTQWKSMSGSDKRFMQTLYPKASKTPKFPLDSNTKESNECLNPSDSQVLNEEIETKLIDALVKYKEKEELMDTKFFFMSSNIQCVVNKEYRPLEVGIIEYTIKDGIRMNYHQFIDCGEVPYGYAFKALDHMKTTHKIPVKNFVKASNDYVLIGSRILEVLSDSCHNEEINQLFNKPMIVFSKTEQIDQNKGALKWIGKKCNEMLRRDEQQVYNFNTEVLSVSKLLSALLNSTGDNHSMGWYEDVTTSHAFDYAIGTDCEFHEDIDCIECALGVPKRLAYLMSYFLRKSFDMSLTDKHFPSVEGFENLRIKEDEEVEELPFDFKLTEEDILKVEEQEEGNPWDTQTKVKDENTSEEDNKGSSELNGKSGQPKAPVFRRGFGVGRAKHILK